jgi:hypothetical protein
MAVADTPCISTVQMGLKHGGPAEVEQLTVAAAVERADEEEENPHFAWRRMLDVLEKGSSDNTHHYYLIVDVWTTCNPAELRRQMDSYVASTGFEYDPAEGDSYESDNG